MNKKILIFIILIAIILLGFIKIWPQYSIFGTQRINSFELLGGCWMGDVRVCDYDPFE